MKNENKYEEMVDIMDDIHKYVPTVSSKVEVDVPGAENETVELDMDQSVPLYPDGRRSVDCSTCSRYCSNSERQKERLEGLVPVCEDWHAKMCLLGVSVLNLFSSIFSNYVENTLCI